MAKKKVKAGAAQSPSEVAFYYPGPMWFSGDALKNLLLFFDGIALLVPRYMLDRPERREPWLVGPLRKAGLLHLLEPETLVDKATTQDLATAIVGLVQSGDDAPCGSQGLRPERRQ